MPCRWKISFPRKSKRGTYLVFRYVVLICFVIFLSFTHIFTSPPARQTVKADNIETDNDYSTSLSLFIPGEWEPVEPPSPPPVTPEVLEPLRINWYDLQNSWDTSWLNDNIDVNNRYRFCVNISCDYGWETITSIEIYGWYDNGNEGTSYNSSFNLGGNRNMLLKYENIGDSFQYRLVWPHKGVTPDIFTVRAVTDPKNNQGVTDCYNCTFSFRPGYQFCFAPGDGDWDKTRNTFNDLWSWNFKIIVRSEGTKASGPKTVSVIDEFGVHPYSEIICIGTPYMSGIPGDDTSVSENITLITRSNANYILSIDVKPFTHRLLQTKTISNQSVWVDGGDLKSFTNFSGNKPLYLHGSPLQYILADGSNESRTIGDIRFKCSIPYAQFPGEYIASVYYTLLLQLNV
jgi:hypothetical protein